MGANVIVYVKVLKLVEEETNLEILDAIWLEGRGFAPDLKNNKPFTTWAHLYKMIFKGHIGIRLEETGIIKSQRWLTKDQALNEKLTDWSRYTITEYA